MYNIITAIGNENINNELRNVNKYNIVYGDIMYQEALIEVIEKNNIDKLILYDNLVGSLNKFDLIEKLLQVKDTLDIIVILDKQDTKFTNFLISKGVFKIIDLNEITIELICENIDNKIENEKEKGLYNEINKLKEKIQTTTKEINIRPYDKKVITVNGTSGSGKTTFLVNLAITLARSYNKKVLIIDLDTITASVDKFVDISIFNKNVITNLDTDKKCVLNYLADSIEKNNFDFDVLTQSVMQYQKQKNVFVLTGNTSMFVCQNVLNTNHYSKILEKAKEMYDYIVIDTNSCLFLDSTKWSLQNADIIYYLFEGTYKDFSNMKNSLIIYKKAWDILYDKFEFILNKCNKHSLSKTEISNLDNSINISSCINYSDKYIEGLNNMIPVVFNSINEKIVYENILGINRQMNMLEKIYKNIKGVF